MGIKRRAVKYKDDEDQAPAESSQREVVLDGNELVKQASFFTAILTQANTYDLIGMSFRRGVPKKVPMRFYELFKSNGWFKVSTPV